MPIDIHSMNIDPMDISWISGDVILNYTSDVYETCMYDILLEVIFT